MPSSSMTFPIHLSKTRARVRTRGWGEVFSTVAGRIRSGIRSDDEVVFLKREANWTGEVVRKSDEPLHLARATPEDGIDYERYIGTDSARSFAWRLTDSTACWLVRGRGMILHATWTTTGAAWTREIRRNFVPPPSSAYIYESFTRSEARGLGLYPYALVGIGKELANDGIETLYVGVEVGNTPSLRAITKAGFRTSFSVSFHRRWGRFRLDPATGPDADSARELLKDRPRKA